MDALFGLIGLFLIGVWAVWVIKGNQQRPRNNERFIGVSKQASLQIGRAHV